MYSMTNDELLEEYSLPRQVERLEYCQKYLKENDVKWCITIPTYTRANHFTTFRRIQESCSETFMKEKVFAFIHEDELESYRRSTHDKINFVIVPEEYYGIGDTRKFCFKWGEEHGYFFVFNWDDDIDSFNIVKLVLKDGELVSRISTRTENKSIPMFMEKYLCGVAAISDFLFKSYPSLRAGSIRRRHMILSREISTTLSLINKYTFPQGTGIWKVKDFTKNADYYYPLGAKWHGDDIISSLQLLANKESVFYLSWLCNDFISAQKSSVVRDIDEESPRNRELHRKEFEAIQKLEGRKWIKPLVVNGEPRIYSDGLWMYSTIDWKKYYSYFPEMKGIRIPLSTLDPIKGFQKPPPFGVSQNLLF